MNGFMSSKCSNGGMFGGVWKSMLSPKQGEGRTFRRLSALNSNMPSVSVQRQRHQQIFVKNQIILVDNRYLEIGELQGCGGFADVYDCKFAFGKDNNKKLTKQTLYKAQKTQNSVSCLERLSYCGDNEVIELVAKVERDDNVEFDTEHGILKHLSELKADFMPPVLCMGLFDEHRIIVMQRLSMDCETLLKNE
eukprot:119530_1